MENTRFHGSKAYLATRSFSRPACKAIYFSKENLTIFAKYQDEISAYRARRKWLKTLDEYFFLDDASDFILQQARSSGEDEYYLICQFVSPAARYAFFRLVNLQALEAQYQLETAHHGKVFDFTDEYYNNYRLDKKTTRSILSRALSWLLSKIKERLVSKLGLGKNN
ncbi:MAG TPA: hypothetical protein PKD37_04670 [Oligoflexia bacterium]|nr:hypothetical protein [Oligoflexia bacterium]HMP27258.1 hypothetical protein [Oligoflexia bacterium]